MNRLRACAPSFLLSGIWLCNVECLRSFDQLVNWPDGGVGGAYLVVLIICHAQLSCLGGLFVLNGGINV
jgi:hypothetical protein